jgi:hypothetical protein
MVFWLSHIIRIRLNERITLEWIFKDLCGSRQEEAAGSFQHVNEPSGSIKCGELLDLLSK